MRCGESCTLPRPPSAENAVGENFRWASPSKQNDDYLVSIIPSYHQYGTIQTSKQVNVYAFTMRRTSCAVRQVLRELERPVLHLPQPAPRPRRSQRYVQHLARHTQAVRKQDPCETLPPQSARTPLGFLLKTERTASSSDTHPPETTYTSSLCVFPAALSKGPGQS